jgi:hypothetical protein
MANYTKGIVAGVGVLVFAAKTFFDLDLSSQADNFVNLGIAIATAIGVISLPNKDA